MLLISGPVNGLELILNVEGYDTFVNEGCLAKKVLSSLENAVLVSLQ